jgi:hypothetical protein
VPSYAIVPGKNEFKAYQDVDAQLVAKKSFQKCEYDLCELIVDIEIEPLQIEYFVVNLEQKDPELS